MPKYTVAATFEGYSYDMNLITGPAYHDGMLAQAAKDKEAANALNIA